MVVHPGLDRVCGCVEVCSYHRKSISDGSMNPSIAAVLEITCFSRRCSLRQPLAHLSSDQSQSQLGRRCPTAPTSEASPLLSNQKRNASPLISPMPRDQSSELPKQPLKNLRQHIRHSSVPEPRFLHLLLTRIRTHQMQMPRPTIAAVPASRQQPTITISSWSGLVHEAMILVSRA